MLGALFGLGTSLLGGLFSGDASANANKAAYDAKMKYLNQKENDNKNQYQYNKSSSRAAINATLTEGYNNMASGLNDAYQKGAMMGDESGRSVAGLQQAALNQMGTSARQGAVLAEQAANKATDTYYQNKSNILDKKMDAESSYQTQKAQQASTAGTLFSTIGGTLLRSDMSSILNSGKGAFETAFGSTASKVPGATVSLVDPNNPYTAGVLMG